MTQFKDKEIRLFTENRRLGGHNIHVIDDWGYKLKTRFVKEREKELYLKEFGEKLISDEEFYKWWLRINNQ